MMAAAAQLYSFSEDCSYLASSGPDGRLKIFETATGILKLEYVPSCHLTAACTSLSWAPHVNETPARKKLKTKNSSIHGQADKLNLLAMGTLTGKIVLYSLSKGDLQSEMTGGHSESVNCIGWNFAANEIFSCSNDGHVVRWNFSKGSIKSKWKADKGPVSSLAVLPEGRTLLTSGRSIKFWDIEKKELIKKFSGHSSSVFQLQLVNFPNKLSEEGYFISAAAGDRHLSAWHLKNDDQNCVASFSLSENALCFDVAGPQPDSNKVSLAAVTRTGVVHLFEHHLNGKIRKPLQPISTVQIATGKDQEAQQVPIVACRMVTDDDNSILLAYGNTVKLSFDRVPYSSCSGDVCLVRQDPLNSVSNFRKIVKNASKVSVPIVPQDSMVITVGYVAPSGITQSQFASVKGKRKFTNNFNDVAPFELPMEEKLSGLKIGPAPTTQDDFPSSGNLTHLLIQGLHSKDQTILDSVLNRRNPEDLRKTITRLPVEHIAPLIRVVGQRLQMNQSGKLNQRSHLTCLSAIFSSHISFLMTYPDLQSLLKPVQHVFNDRLDLVKKLFQLKGKMEMIVSQLNTKDSGTSNSVPALVAYNDESSDEADSYIDDLLPSHSESEAENWNDFSDEDGPPNEDDEEDYMGAMDVTAAVDSSEEESD